MCTLEAATSHVPLPRAHTCPDTCTPSLHPHHKALQFVDGRPSCHRSTDEGQLFPGALTPFFLEAGQKEENFPF